MNLRQTAQQALEAWFRPHGINYVDFKPYMEALRAALAEPEQEPWKCACGANLYIDPNGKPQSKAAPTPRKPLSLDEIEALLWDGEKLRTNVEYARAIETHHGITGEQT